MARTEEGDQDQEPLRQHSKTSGKLGGRDRSGVGDRARPFFLAGVNDNIIRAQGKRLSTSSAELPHGVEHRDHVLRRDVGQHVVDLLEDKAAAAVQDLDLAADVLRMSAAWPWRARTACRNRRPRR